MRNITKNTAWHSWVLLDDATPILEVMSMQALLGSFHFAWLPSPNQQPCLDSQTTPLSTNKRPATIRHTQGQSALLLKLLYRSPSKFQRWYECSAATVAVSLQTKM